MSMSISYVRGGRERQKGRTRRDLIEAARELIAQGESPSVEQAAATAGVSRATAYRYFTNQRELLIAAHPEFDRPTLLGDKPPADPEARLDLVVRRLAEMFAGAEGAYRTMLRLALEPDRPDDSVLVLRKGLRLEWIGDALAPLHGRLSDRAFERLLHSIAATVGIEAFVVLTDMVGLSWDQAVEVVRWSARALLRSAQAESKGVD